MKGWPITRNIVTEQKFKELDFHSFLTAKELLRHKGELKVTILGKSMVPLYQPTGQVVEIKPIADLSELKRFDIIIFWQHNKLIAHYYWKQNSYFIEDVNDPNLVTRPLNPIKSFDHPIRFNHILGIVPEKMPLWLKLKILFNIIF